MRKLGTRSRNRGPCRACQASKRKCDQAKPQCSRCRQHNVTCEPSPQARWRVRTAQDAHGLEATDQSTTQRDSPVTVQQNPLPNQDMDTVDERNPVQDAPHLEIHQENLPHMETGSDLLDDENLFPGLHGGRFIDSCSYPAQAFTVFPWPSIGIEGLPPLLFSAPPYDQACSSTVPENPASAMSSLDAGNMPFGDTGTPTTANEAPAEAQAFVDTSSSASTTASSTLSATIKNILSPASQPLAHLRLV